MEIRDKHFITPDFIKEKIVEKTEKLNNDRKFKESLQNPDKENKGKTKEKEVVKKQPTKERIIDITV